MENLFCLSLDFRGTPVKDRAAAWEDESVLRRFVDEGKVLEILPLHTCNRAELFLVVSEGECPSELERPGAHRYQGLEVARHLLRVLLGLESIALGEEFVVHQVRNSYEKYSDELCGRVLHRLFQRALGLSASLRQAYHPGRPPSIPWLMVQEMKAREGWERCRSLVVGSGVMGQEILRILRALGMEATLTNRTAERGWLCARELGALWLPWEDWKAQLNDFKNVFLCTGARESLLSAEDILPDTFVFDLGSPPQANDSVSERGKLVRVDGLATRAENLFTGYSRQLKKLSREAERVSKALWDEIETLNGQTYMRLAMSRARNVAKDRADRTARQHGYEAEVLEAMAWSIVKGVLDPVLQRKNHPHTQKIWRALVGEGKGNGA